MRQRDRERERERADENVPREEALAHVQVRCLRIPSPVARSGARGQRLSAKGASGRTRGYNSERRQMRRSLFSAAFHSRLSREGKKGDVEKATPQFPVDVLLFAQSMKNGRHSDRLPPTNASGAKPAASSCRRSLHCFLWGFAQPCGSFRPLAPDYIFWIRLRSTTFA